MESYTKAFVSFLGVRAREARELAREHVASLLDVVTARARASAAEKREEVLAVALAAERYLRRKLERGTTAAHQRIEAINEGTRRRLNGLDAALEKTRADRDEARRIAAERLAELTRAQERAAELERELGGAQAALADQAQRTSDVIATAVENATASLQSRAAAGAEVRVVSGCICPTILAADPLRHFKECPRREPLPEGHPAAPLDAAVARAERAEAALAKISAIRDSIIGFQRISWSEHIYPLVAVLGEAGYEGAGYDKARENVGTLLDQLAAAESQLKRWEPVIEAARWCVEDDFAMYSHDTLKRRIREAAVKEGIGS